MAATLTFDKANNVLTVQDTVTNRTHLLTGAVALQMEYQNATAATYFLYSSGINIRFQLSEISTIGGSAPDTDPVTALGQLKAVLPLYA